MSAIDPADVLALLEEKPYHEHELVEAFGASLPIVRFTLKEMKRDGHLKRVGAEQKWALASYVAPVGQKPLVDRNAVFAQLQGEPIGRSAIAKILSASPKSVQYRLAELAATGMITSVGKGTHLRWALAGWTEPPPVPPRPRGRPRKTPQVDEVVELEDDDDNDPADEELAGVDPDAAIVDAELVPPRNHEKLLGTGGRRLYPVGTRQEPVKKLRVAEQPAWWVQFAAADKRDEFMTAAAARDAEMQRSPGWRSQTKVNQEPRG